MRASSLSEVQPRSAGIEELNDVNCITDVRGDVLRIGFAIYHDRADVERLAALLEGLS